ncbi:MAG: site-specific integrase [Nocardioides sp.]
MTDQRKRRERGEGSIFWSEERQRWVAVLTIGYDGRGKRIVRKRFDKTKTGAKQKLANLKDDLRDGLQVDDRSTVADAARDWLAYGLGEVGDTTRDNYTSLVQLHIVDRIGAYRLHDLRSGHLDRWLAQLSPGLSRRSLTLVLGILRRILARAVNRDLMRRNVADSVALPRGRNGRPSKALTLGQARDIMEAFRGHWLEPYVVLSILTGARTEELRALRWEDVVLKEDATTDPATPPHMAVWRSVRVGGDTKTRRSRRTLALPTLAVESLEKHRVNSGQSGDRGLVFPSRAGTALDAHNVRRAFRARLALVEGIAPADWTPRELRHTFVSLLSDAGMPLEAISQLVGHKGGSHVTEAVYRHQIRPVIQTGATAMDAIFDPR